MAVYDITTRQMCGTPTANFFGSETFTYTVNDGHGGSDIMVLRKGEKAPVPGTFFVVSPSWLQGYAFALHIQDKKLIYIYKSLRFLTIDYESVDNRAINFLHGEFNENYTNTNY